MRERAPTVRELVALIVAAGASLSVVALALGAALEIASPTAHLSQAASSVLATALGAMIGAVASFLGSRTPIAIEPAPTEPT